MKSLSQRINFTDIIVFLLMITMAYLVSRVIAENPGLSVSGWVFGIAPVAAVGAVIAVIKMGGQSGYDILSVFKFSQHNLSLKAFLAAALLAAVTGVLIIINPFDFIMPAFTVIIISMFTLSVFMIANRSMVDAVGLLLVTLPFITYVEYQVVKLTGFDSGWITIKVAVILFFAMIWFISNFIIQNKGIVKGKFNTLVLIFILTTLFSAVFSEDIVYSLKRWLFEAVYPLIIFFVVINSIRHEADIRRFINYLIGSVFLNLVMIMYYFVKYGSSSQDNKYVLNLDFMDGVLVANVLIMVIPVVIALLVLSRKKSLKLLYFVLIILGVIGIALSFARMPQICLATGLLAFLFIKETRKYVLLTLTLAVLLFSFYINKMDPYLSKYQDLTSIENVIHEESMEIRYSGWKSAAEMFRDHPLTGVGIGRYNQEYGNYNTLIYRNWAMGFVPMITAHSIYLTYLAETGVFGILSLLALLSAIVITGFSIIKKQDENRVFKYSLLVAVIIFLGNNMISGITFAYVREIDKGMIFWSIAAVIMSYGVMEKSLDSQLIQENPGQEREKNA